MWRIRIRVQPVRKTRVASFTYSGLLHILFVSAMMFGPRPAPPRKIESHADLIRKSTIIYYPQRKIPEISPPADSAKNALPRPLPERKQTIASTLPDAKLRNQLIWQASAVKLEHEVPAPNIVELNVPAPEVRKPAARAFTPSPAAPAPVPAPSLILEAPPVNTTESKLTLPAASLKAELPKQVARRFVPAAPSRDSGVPSTPTIADAAPEIESGNQKNLSAIVVGLTPALRLDTPLPAGILPAQVSAAPDESITGKAGRSDKNGMRAPNVIVHDGSEPPPNPPPNVPRTSPLERARAAQRATLSAPLYKSSRTLPAVIETYFGQRTAYTCLLEGLIGIKSSAMWFTDVAAESSAPPGRSPLIRAPVLVHAELPKGKQPERPIFLKMIIRQDGQVESATLLQPSDNPLSQALAHLSADWEFAPATRNGQPVQVEAIIELSFASATHL